MMYFLKSCFLTFVPQIDAPIEIASGSVIAAK